MQTELLEVIPGADAVVVGLNVKRPVQGGFAREHSVYQVLKVRHRHIVDIRGYGNRAEAAAAAGIATRAEHAIEARQLVPILNVSDLEESIAWFAKLGWAKRWGLGRVGRPADVRRHRLGRMRHLSVLERSGRPRRRARRVAIHLG